MDLKEKLSNEQYQAENMIYRSYMRARPYIPAGDDSVTRHPQWTRKLLDMVGQPDKGLKIILVTGSKGKGSTSFFIASLLKSLGFQAGLFTSPHLVDFTERIRVNGKAIGQSDFIRLCGEIAPAVESIEAGLDQHEYQGPVGIAMAVALLYFREQKVDFAIIEAGRGGTFDDTNVLQNQWAVITSIFAEHVENLGPTVGDIVRHKLGIVKATTEAVIVNHQEANTLSIIEQNLSLSNVRAFYYGREFQAEDIHINRLGTEFQVKSSQGWYPQLYLPIWGEFQAFNAATAIQACEVIVDKPLPPEMVHTTFQNLRWPGRCEIISEDPLTMVDGAINGISAEYVRQIIETIGFQNITTIIGVPSDKDYQGVIRVASTFSNDLILTRPEETHKSFPVDAIEFARTCMEECREIYPLSKALAYAKAQKNVDLILIIGTQTLIGNAKRLYHQSLFEL